MRAKSKAMISETAPPDDNKENLPSYEDGIVLFNKCEIGAKLKQPPKKSGESTHRTESNLPISALSA